MKTQNLILSLATTATLLVLSNPVQANSYDINYVSATPDNTVATGQLTVLDGIATGGYLNVLSGPDAGSYTLVTGSGTDSSFVYDTFVFPGSDNGFVDSTAGFLWSVSGLAGNSSEVNMWFNPVAQWGARADSYSLWGAPGNWNLKSYGTASLTPSVTASFQPASAPDSSSTLTLLGAGFTGLMTLRRKLGC